VIVSAAAYPTADATGVSQAGGSITVEVKPGQTTTTPALTMDSTISEIRVTPASLSLSLCEAKTLAAAAFSAQGEVVISPGRFRWAANNSTVTLVPSGNIVEVRGGTQAGTSNVTATYTEGDASQGGVSKTSAPVPVTVNAAPPSGGGRIVDLGATTAGNSFGRAISPGDLSAVHVVGRESPPGLSETAFEYSAGSIYNIGTIGDAAQGTLANDINATFNIVGTANSQNLATATPFLFRDANGNHQRDAGEMVSLGYVGEAEAINDSNVIVGSKINPATSQRTNGFVDNAGQVTDLANLGGTRGQALDINNSGLVVGASELAGGERHACYWQVVGANNPSPVDLGALTGSTNSLAVAVNNFGVAVGSSFVPEAGSIFLQPRAVVITTSDNRIVELPRLNATDRFSEAFGINDNGDIVGRINVGTGLNDFKFVAVKWSRDANGNYQVVNLNTLHSTSWELSGTNRVDG